MKTKQLLSKYLFGLTIPQQYICLPAEDISTPVRVMLTTKDRIAIPVDPIFIGYKPVIFALLNNSLKTSECCLNFYSQPDFHANSKWHNFPVDGNSVARMVARSLLVEFKTLPKLTLLQGEIGDHSFLGKMHRRLNSFREKFTQNKPGNVDLSGNLHDMVRIAYSIPRIIALVSISNGTKMNLFPTDLHGQLDETFYMSSLRIGGNAQEQVQRYEKIVLCEVESDSFDETYRLGKNHMKDFSPVSDFSLSPASSEKFGFSLPAKTLRYFELSVVEFVDVGIHRIFLYRIANKKIIKSGKTLSHIHQYYAEWRKRNGFKTDLLLR